MDLTAFVDVPEERRVEFFDHNAMVHEAVFSALLELGVITEHYPLWTPAPTDDWKAIHYREHQAWAAALSIAPAADLGAFDAENEASWRPWLYNHYLHHVAVAAALNL